MSLSDWDTLALDERGRPSNGTTDESPCGLTVEAKENYLLVSGPKLWQHGCLHPHPTLAAVQHADVCLYDLGLRSERGPRKGVYWATWFSAGGVVHATVGLACWGWDEDMNWTGAPPEAVAHLHALLEEWAAAEIIPSRLGTLAFGNALRYNQGDRFFAKQMGHALPSTPVGSADLPMLYASRQAQEVARVPGHR